MPNLTRTKTRLLRTVNGKAHATQDDHHDALPTPPATNSTRSSGSQSKVTEGEEDIFRDPESSEDEKPVPPFKPASIDGAQDLHIAPATFKTARSYVPPSPEAAKKEWKRPSLKSPRGVGSKRSNESEERESSDGEKLIMSSQGSVSKRLKTAVGNIHALPPRKPKATYGSKSRRAQGSSQSSKFKKLDRPAKKEEEPAVPQFQRAKGVDDMFQFQGTPAHFNTPGSAQPEDASSLSPSLSSLLSDPPDSPDVEEIAALDLPDPHAYTATIPCAICSAEVPLTLKESFENQFTDGKAMSFKWQQRFCRHHREEDAKHAYRESGYPEIDWSGLGVRMHRFDGALRDVISGRLESSWKAELGRQLRGSKSKSSSASAADAQQVRAGYYGPRGEKAMAEHIVTHLADNLRERAGKDRIVAASGVKGGMSGFVHGVLVPELACRLIAEDLRVEMGEARAVVGRSGEMGGLVHPDLGEDDVGGNEHKMEVEE